MADKFTLVISSYLVLDICKASYYATVVKQTVKGQQTLMYNVVALRQQVRIEVRNGGFVVGAGLLLVFTLLV